MRYFIDYYPSDAALRDGSLPVAYDIRPVVQLHELRDIAERYPDEQRFKAVARMVEYLLNHKDVLFVGNPVHFDSIVVPGRGSLAVGLIRTALPLDCSEHDLDERLEWETEEGQYALIVREVLVKNYEIVFRYHYEYRERLGLDAAIRRCLIDEVLEDMEQA